MAGTYISAKARARTHDNRISRPRLLPLSYGGGVGVSCCVFFFNSFVSYLYVSGSGSVTSVGKERAKLFAIVYLHLCGFC